MDPLPHIDPHPTRYDQPKARRSWWVCLLKFLAKLILRRKGG